MSQNNLLYFSLFDHCHGNHPPVLKISSRFEIRALMLPSLQIVNFLTITIEKIDCRLVPHLNVPSEGRWSELFWSFIRKVAHPVSDRTQPCLISVKLMELAGPLGHSPPIGCWLHGFLRATFRIWRDFQAFACHQQ